MTTSHALSVLLRYALLLSLFLSSCTQTLESEASDAGSLLAAAGIETIPGMPPVVDPSNLYSETGAGMLSPRVEGHLSRIYVPTRRANEVWVIDPDSRTVVDRFRVGTHPQHIVPSHDLQTLWVTNNAEGRTDGSLTPIDPRTGRPGETIPVDNPYNLYFTPDGRSALVVAEARRRLDFRDPVTLELRHSLEVPECNGVNHGDFSIDGRFALFTCEFAGSLIRVDLLEMEVTGLLPLSRGGMPQDIRISPDGTRFYVADMHADGVFVIDAEGFQEVGFIPTGVGAHGLYPDREGRRLFVANRGTHRVSGVHRGQGSVTVLDFGTGEVLEQWPIPGGGSPDMGNVTADGGTLWLSGRFDHEVYAIDTRTGEVERIQVGLEPHGLTVWPQPGRYSLGHTGNMR